MNRLFKGLMLAILLVSVACQAPQKKEEVKLSDEERMQWWNDARFGMFIHWGAYSMLGGEYKDSICWGGAEWVMDKLDMTIEEYEKYPQSFNPVKFDADAWVALAKNAGMKYIVLTTKHHDGFCLWDSEVTDYDIMDTAPFKRDIVKELSEACKKEDIKFCIYHSITDWHHPEAQSVFYPDYNIGQDDQTASNPDFPKYYENYLKPQIGELLTKYGEVGVVWFDGEWISDYTTEMGKDLYNFILEKQPNTIVNNRVDKGRNGMAGFNKEGDFAGDFGTPEKEVPDTGMDEAWEACFTMNGSWGYKPSDENWKSDTLLIQSFVDIVSKGGNFLLNIGPDGLGEVPIQSVERLNTIGEWMKVNGEAIYGAQASPYERPEWGCYTSKGGYVYAHVFDWPANGVIKFNDKMKVSKATLLGRSNELEISGNSIRLPKKASNPFVSVIKLKVK